MDCCTARQRRHNFFNFSCIFGELTDNYAEYFRVAFALKRQYTPNVP